MANFAIHDGQVVSNVIVAESRLLAEQLTGQQALLTEGSPWIGWTLEVDGWRPPKPHSSWIWDGERWQPPVPVPDEGGPWSWDEDTLSWVEVTV